MPKVVVTGICNVCGKSFERKFYFETKEAALAWENSDSVKNQICEACEEERKSEEAAKHRIQMTIGGMAELEGSPKQIAWAEKIRATFFELAEDMWMGAVEAIEREEIYGGSSEEIKSELKVSEMAERYLLTQVTSASWWINNRSYLTDSFVLDAELASIYKSHKEEIEAMGMPEDEAPEENEEEHKCVTSENSMDEETSKDEPITIELPELIGSPKQIAWATEIRNRFAREASYIIRYNDEEKSDPAGYFRKAFAKVFAIRDCVTWIENRKFSIHDWIDITKNVF